MKTSPDSIINPEFSDLCVQERVNPYHTCIQGRANEPITVLALLRRAKRLLSEEAGFAGLGDFSLATIVRRLAENRPRVCIIRGSEDHPAHLLDDAHVLRAAVRIWQNGGVPFTFSVPVICDGTAQSNIGQSYSLASRNHTASAVNINFEGHSYHAAYVLAGCDKSPTGILSGLAAADRARRHPERGSAPVWAVFVPAHVLRGGRIPAEVMARFEVLKATARAAGDGGLADDIEENCRYILQCSSDEAFLGLLNRAVEHHYLDRAEADQLLDELAAATCDEQGGICAFNGSGNSSRTLVSALGFVPPASELLTGAPPTQVVADNVDQLFRLLNRPEYSVCALLERNFANAVRIHDATGGSSNLMLHMPAVMRYAGFDVSLFDYERIRAAHPVPDVFAHSLTEGRDTFVFAQQAAAGWHHGVTSVYKVLGRLGVPLDLAAPTVSGQTWAERVAAVGDPVARELPQDRSLIRLTPVREVSGTDILRGNICSSATLKLAGLSSETMARFDGRIFVVRYYENEAACNRELRSGQLVESLAAMPALTPRLLSALAQANGSASLSAQAATARALIEDGRLAFAFVIAGQGPSAFGMPEMFAPSQSLRHHGIIERSSLLMTDGRYSGVTKGACIGHVVPEANAGGAIGALQDGDLLWLRFGERRIDLIDPQAFFDGRCEPLDTLPFAERQDLIEARQRRIEERKLQIAATSLLDHETNAEYGVVPLSVHRRATLRWGR